MANSKKYTLDDVERLKVFYPRETERHRRYDLIDVRFGRLQVIEFGGYKARRNYWFCRCECGQITQAIAGNLRAGKTISCGCILKEGRGIGTPWESAYDNRQGLPVGKYRSHKGRSLPPFHSIESYYKPERGYRVFYPGFLYLHAVNKRFPSGRRIVFYKYGISNDWPEKRCEQYNKKSSYEHTLRGWWCFEDGAIALKLESECKRRFDYRPQNLPEGKTEAFSPEEIGIFYELVDDTLQIVTSSYETQGRVCWDMANWKRNRAIIDAG